jgi:hypothetical protein
MPLAARRHPERLFAWRRTEAGTESATMPHVGASVPLVRGVPNLLPYVTASNNQTYCAPARAGRSRLH